MASENIPDPLERRHLIERDLPADKAIAIADAYLADDRLEEAVIFLSKAKAHDRLEGLWGRAVEVGNVFLLRSVADALGREPSSEVWLKLESAAREAGLECYADTAKRHARRDDD